MSRCNGEALHVASCLFVAIIEDDLVEGLGSLNQRGSYGRGLTDLSRNAKQLS